MSGGFQIGKWMMNHTVLQLAVNCEGLQITPAGLLLPVPAHRVRSRSIRSPRYISRTIERDVRGTETGSPAHS